MRSTQGRPGTAVDPVDGRRVVVIGISGPDGAGKTTLAAALARRLEADGRVVVTVHPYGCVFCRRLPESLRDPVEANGGRSGWIAVRRALHVVHGLIDAAELAARLRLVRGLRPAKGRAGSGPAVVLADRSALDGLVKFRPRPGGLLERVFRGLVRGFDAILLLQVPPGELARRDRAHTERSLAVVSERFRTAARELPIVVRIDADRPLEDVVRESAGSIGPLIAWHEAAPTKAAPLGGQS